MFPRLELGLRRQWTQGSTIASDGLRAVSKKPRTELLDQANAASRNGRYAEAAEIYAVYLSKWPNDGGIHLQCGHMNKEAKRFDLAERHYLAAKRLMPTDADLNLQLGHFYKVTGRVAAALAAYQTAARLRPDWIEALSEIGAMRRALNGLPDLRVSGNFDHDLSRQSRTVDATFINHLYGFTVPPNTSFEHARALAHQHAPSQVFYPNLNFMLVLNGIAHPKFLELFNPTFYRFMNDFPDGARPSARAQCLRHFCESGLNEGFDIAEAHRFDRDFYAGTYLDQPSESDRAVPAEAHSRGDLFRHWINVGLPAGWSPNAREFYRTETGVDVCDLADLHLPIYRRANNDLRDMADQALAIHLLQQGALENRPGLVLTAANAPTFAEVAHAASESGMTEQAAVLFDLIMHHVPGYDQAITYAADNRMKLGRHRDALQLYRKAIRDGSGTVWSSLNCAAMLAHLRDPRGRYEVLRTARQAFADDANLLPRRLKEASDHFFSAELAAAQAVAEWGEIDRAQQMVARLATDLTSDIGSAAAPKPIEAIAIVSGCDIMQCRLYRVEQKAEQLRAAGYKVRIFSWTDDITAFDDQIHLFQAAIFYRVLAYPTIIKSIQRAREFGLATFYETDDLLFDPAEFPGPYKRYAGSITPQQYSELATSVPLYAHAMRLCDYGIASTPTLAEEMRGHVRSGSVFVHRNGFGTVHERNLQTAGLPAGRDRVTIFYGSGTKAHKEDFHELVEPALERLVKEHGDKLSIVVLGYNPLSGRSEALARAITVAPPMWNVEAFWQVLGRADISLAVVKPTLNTACKSEIKWLEAAMFRIPSVVSRTPTYGEVIEHGVNGFLAETSDDFFVAIDRLVRDAGYRRKVGEAAYRTAVERYGVDDMARNLRGIMRSVSPAFARKRKIVVVNVFYPPQAVGGGTRVVHDNIKDLRNLYGSEYEFEVFTSIVGGPDAYGVHSYVDDGVRVTGVVPPDVPDLSLRPSDPKMERIFDSFLEHAKPNLVHFHCIQTLTASVVAAAQKRQIPYVITMHDGWWVANHQFFTDENGDNRTYDFGDVMGMLEQQGTRAVERMAALRGPLFGARMVLVVSERFSAICRTAGVTHIRSVPNGLSKIPVVERVPSPDGRVRLAYVGGTTAEKGYLLIRYALQRSSFRHLDITVVDLTRQKGNVSHEVWGTTPVTIIPKVAQAEVHELYARTDVLLAPSTCVESFGLATREAIALGCWVVASDRGSIGEPLVQGENGFVISVDDLGDLIGTLAMLDADPGKFTRPPGRQLPVRTAEDQARDLHAIYDEILAPGRQMSRGAAMSVVGSPLG